jgi:IMP dehydrogenase
LALSFDDVLLIPHYSDILPKQVSLKTRLAPGVLLHTPFVAAAMDTVTEAPMAQAMALQGALGVIHKNSSADAQAAQVAAVKAYDGPADNSSRDAAGKLQTGAAVGIGPDQSERAAKLVAAGADLLVVDTAHGHTAGVIAAVRQLRRAYPHLALVAGNVATAEATYALLEAGADTVKVGIGPGSICTTRQVAGVGVPQLSAVMACAEAARSRNATVIADGGIRTSGDIVKALAAGAAAVMMGGMFAGCDEAPGDIVHVDGVAYKAYRGMGSLGAMQAGSADRYFQDAKLQPQKLVAEGVAARVLYKGPVEHVVYQLAGGLRSGMGYLGASHLEALFENAQFVRMSAAGVRESGVHDVFVTPNA